MQRTLTDVPFIVELQREDDTHDLPRVEAGEVVKCGRKGLELSATLLMDDPTDEEHRTLTDVIFLTIAGWQQLVELYALRHPADAQRIITKALGWQGERGRQEGGC